MDLVGDLRTEILLHLPVQDANSRADLEAFSTPDLLIRYLAWRERLAHSHPRHVHKSRRLLSHPTYAQRRNDIHRIFAKVKVGLDVNPHLSKGVRFGYERPKPGRKDGRHIDGLLNEWGVHHLHLSHEMGADGFTGRDDPVLAVIFQQEDAYFLDVIQHGEWAEDRLVEIAVSEWPNAGLFTRLSVSSGSQQPTSTERMRLRKIGYSTSITVNGAIYMPNTGGITTALTPARAQFAAMRLLRQLKAVTDNPQSVIIDYKKDPGFDRRQWPRSPRLRVTCIAAPNGFSFALQEDQTGLLLSLAA